MSAMCLFYTREQDLTLKARLNAYYVFIHPYFPILPPPLSSPEIDCPISLSSITAMDSFPYTWSSPLGLAISAILALIPLSQERHYLSTENIASRRLVSQRFAQRALELVEADSEFLDFTSAHYMNSDGSSEQLRLSRAPIHQRTPVELESVLALLILTLYEHIQRGNLLKMAARAGQALIIAKCMSLHLQGPEVNEFSESKRRAWWMTVSRTTL